MKIVKMHGCGNDFVFAKYEEDIDYKALAIKLCNRHIGIGGDGLILVKEKPLEMIYYNSDGSRAPMCGNGIRCFALFCYHYHIVDAKVFDVVTLAGIMKVDITSVAPFNVRINMGKTYFSNEMIHAFDYESYVNRQISVKGSDVTITSLFLGTIHTIIFVDSFEDKVLELAEDICKHPLFKEGTNVNFVKVVDKNTLIVKTFERGCGWTLACGTGCCASAFIANQFNKTASIVSIMLEYGTLKIELLDDVFMSGPAKIVFESEVEVC